MTIEDDIAFLESVPTFNLLGRAALRILAIGAESRYVHSGEVLFNAGETADGAYIVQEGKINLTTSPAGGTEFTVGPLTLIGELALVAETTRPVTATALEPSSVLRVPRSLFLKTLESFPDAARKLRDLIASRNARSTDDMHAVRDVLEVHNKQT